MTNLIDRLEQRGFVRRTRDPKDRRAIIVAPSPEGIAAFAPFFASTARSVAKLYAPYDEHELAVILDFVKRNTERLRDEMFRLSGRGAAAEKS